MNILLTGGAGFIGSAVTRQLIARGGTPGAPAAPGLSAANVCVLDKLTYAGNLASLREAFARMRPKGMNIIANLI